MKPAAAPRRTLCALAVAVACAACVVQAGEPVGDDGVTAALATPDDEEIARVLASSDDVAWGEYLAGECAACHGASPGEGAAPVIHGTDARRIVRALLAYRSGTRANTTMRSVAAALDDEEIAVLAHYLSVTAKP